MSISSLASNSFSIAQLAQLNSSNQTNNSSSGNDISDAPPPPPPGGGLLDAITKALSQLGASSDSSSTSWRR